MQTLFASVKKSSQSMPSSPSALRNVSPMAEFPARARPPAAR